MPLDKDCEYLLKASILDSILESKDFEKAFPEAKNVIETLTREMLSRYTYYTS